MGRIQKKKTENQKSKLKNKKKQDLTSDGAPGKAAAQKSDAVKRPVVQSKTSAAKKSASTNEPGLYEKCRLFLREVKAELKKVVWPSKNQTIASTVVVIVLVIIVSSFLGLFDLCLKGLIRMVLH